ncbi:MAG: N-acetylmuramidase domain-containing protein [Candidatus Zixiibacteriota bacterium]
MKQASQQEFLKNRKDLQKVALAPAQNLSVPGKPNHRKRLIRRIWNKFGGLLAELSTILKIDPAVAVAILCVESTGRGFAGDGQTTRPGRMIIRFENHIFWKYWGKSHQSDFLTHFKFNRRRPWRGHQFRKNLKAKWVTFHRKGQAGEWDAFEFARSKQQRFAMYSISMGMPQIMGFNHQRIGNESVKKMFDSFSRNEKNQIMGLFDFINYANSKMTQALRRKDFLTFARLYNGPAKAAVYADRIKKYCQEFKELTQKNVDKYASQRILA